MQELTSRDVHFLDDLYEAAVKGIDISESLTPTEDQIEHAEHELMEIYSNAGLSRQPLVDIAGNGWQMHESSELAEDLKEFKITLTILLRNGILKEVPSDRPWLMETVYEFTDLGLSFISACRKPEKAKS